MSIIIRHIKSGGLYEVLGPALIEATLADVTVYRSLQEDGKVWVRPAAEMLDGRFELVSHTLSQAAEAQRPNGPKSHDIVQSLRSLSRHEHDDLSIGIEAADEIEALRKDAARYRWLRAQQWNSSPLAVVCNPKAAIKLGHDSPSLLRLDEAIDAAMAPGATP